MKISMPMPPEKSREATIRALRERTSICIVPFKSSWFPYANPGTNLTYQRFLLTLFAFQCLVSGNFEAATLLLVLASFTDLLDGLAARSLGCESTFGSKLDPLADKFMLLLTWYFSWPAGLIITLSETGGMAASAKVRKNAGKHVIATGSKNITAGQMIFLCLLILMRVAETYGFPRYPWEGLCLAVLSAFSLLRVFLYTRLLLKAPTS